MPVGLEPAASLSRVKHSTTEPLRSPTLLEITHRGSNIFLMTYLGLISEQLFVLSSHHLHPVYHAVIRK